MHDHRPPAFLTGKLLLGSGLIMHARGDTHHSCALILHTYLIINYNYVYGNWHEYDDEQFLYALEPTQLIMIDLIEH